MSKASTRASGPIAPDDAAAPVTGWADCALDSLTGRDTEALSESLGERLAALNIKHAVFSQLPQRAATLSPEAEHGLLTARFVIDAPTRPEPSLLYALHTQGVRGVRFSLAADDERAAVQLDEILRYAERIVPLNWHIELALGETSASLLKHEWTLTRFPVAMCLSTITDRVAHRLLSDPDTDFILALLAMGRTWLKLTGAPLSHSEQADGSLALFATAAVTARSDRIVWGSGAPRRGAVINDSLAHIVRALAALKRWIPNDRLRESVLSTNPTELYGFQDDGSSINP
jgi:predicted TIM-barrel fold metal-dependent hydrolase